MKNNVVVLRNTEQINNKKLSKNKKYIFVIKMRRENDLSFFGDDELTILNKYENSVILKIPYFNYDYKDLYIHTISKCIKQNLPIVVNHHPEDTIAFFTKTTYEMCLEFVNNNFEKGTVYVPNDIYIPFLDLVRYLKEYLNVDYKQKLLIDSYDVKPNHYILSNQHPEINFTHTCLFYDKDVIFKSNSKVKYILSNITGRMFYPDFIELAEEGVKYDQHFY